MTLFAENSAGRFPTSLRVRSTNGRIGTPLKIIHVGPCLARGGAEQSLIDLVRSMDPTVARVLGCLSTSEFIDPDFAADLPVPVRCGGEAEVREAALDCDILLCWGVGLDRWLGDCPPKLCIFLAHGEGDWTRAVLRKSARVVDHVVAVSNRVKESVCDGFPTTVIFNGVDSARLASMRNRAGVRQSFGFSGDDFVLGYVGRFSPEKRVDSIIHATAKLPRRYKVMLVGWGRQKNQLMELANNLIPGRFAFVTASDYLGDYYRSMDAVALVSDQEGFSLVMLEAMLSNKPLIVTPVGAVPELIQDRVNGLIVDGTSDSIAAAAAQLHDHPYWAEGVASEGRVFAEEHGTARRMARDYEKLFARLWNQRLVHA